MNCENCLKEHDGLYGKGRFCSSICARGFSTKAKRSEINEKVSKTLKGISQGFKVERVTKECLNKNCNNIFTVRVTNSKKYCSRDCINTCEIYKKNQSKVCGGYRKGSGRGKSGWYKNFFCDSSWELCYIIYCLDNNIDIKRNKEKFLYTYKNKEHYYLPDFLVNGNYVEIKGRITARWEAKLKAFPHDIEVIYNVNEYIKFVKEKYKVKDVTTLYE